MTKWNGWVGVILRVNLSNGRICKEPLSEGLAYDFVGGRGINSKILYDETGPATDPLGPDNRLIIGTGPTSGTLGLGNGRFTVTAKSPLTGILGDASGGGALASEIKFAGYDHIVFEGRSQKPVYLWINDDEVVLRDAEHLWGKDTWVSSQRIREELRDRDVKTLCIGTAGENLVKYACPITNDERAPAETGMGAVMGSKNLKALAVRGSKSINVANPEKYLKIMRQWYEDIPKQRIRTIHKSVGTPWLIKQYNQAYDLPIKNCQELHRPEEEIRHFYGESFVPKYLVRHLACFSCPHACQKYVLIYDGPYAGEKGRRPDYGSLISVCTQLGIFDFPFGLKVMNTLNRYGIDAQEIGPTMAMAFECYQRGVLTRKDTDGLKLEWGNKDVILELIEKIAYRQGFGDILAEGCRNAAQKIGRGAEKYAYHIKGKSHPDRIVAYIPTVLGFALATRGWDHLRGTIFPHATKALGLPKFLDYNPKYAEAVTNREHLDTIADSFEICKFLTEFALMEEGSGGIPRLAQILSSLTGVDFSAERLHTACDRIYNIERAYLVKNGITREDDVPPRQFLENPIPEGPHKGGKIDREKFEQLKDVFYELRGSDKKTGAPTRATLERLGLNYVADDLEKMGIYNNHQTVSLDSNKP
jgi:aldehyde:ferredoxin oxidoreductase